MSKYIDADAIQIPKTHADAFENCRNCELLDADQVREIIDSAPSIDIVRCGECKYRKNRIDYEKDYCIKHSKVIYNTDGYCSEGEREGKR